VAATVSSNQAAGYQLATSDPVMAIGGFNGTDPAPTLAQFQQMVADGDIHYFVGGARGGLFGGGPTSRAITTWVEDRFSPFTVDHVTLYDLTTPARQRPLPT
jgi:4-amino-4-deoxy-L-arabinose transferase-like glycosyltransferase